MPNLYGVATPLNNGGIVFTPGTTNVTCPAGTNTAIFTFAMNSGYSGVYFPIMWMGFDVLVGATAPSAILTAFQVNGGSNVGAIGSAAAYLVANATFREALNFIGTPAYNFWNAAVSPTITVTVNPTGQGVTVLGSSSSLVAQLFRGPD